MGELAGWVIRWGNSINSPQPAIALKEEREGKCRRFSEEEWPGFRSQSGDETEREYVIIQHNMPRPKCTGVINKKQCNFKGIKYDDCRF